jgi:hypothetical protein
MDAVDGFITIPEFTKDGSRYRNKLSQTFTHQPEENLFSGKSGASNRQRVSIVHT